MIQRSKKPIDKELIIATKSKKKVKLLNEFVGGNKLTNKLVNENNITITMPQPIIKKKRKKKPKISDDAKKNFQQAVKEYGEGIFPPINIPDITTIKTSSDLDKLTNMLNLTMGKPLLAIKGKPDLAIMDGEAKPLALLPSASGAGLRPPQASSSYLGTIGNAYANTVPTNNVAPAPAQAPALTAQPLTLPPLLEGLLNIIYEIFNESQYDTNTLSGYNTGFKYYFNSRKNLPYMIQYNNGEYITKYINNKYIGYSSDRKKEYEKYYFELLDNFEKTIKQNFPDKKPEEITNKQIEDIVNNNTNTEIIEIINKIQLVEENLNINDALSEAQQKYFEDLTVYVNKQIDEEVYKNPKKFHTKFYPKGVFMADGRRPTVLDYQNILLIMNPALNLKKMSKAEVKKLFEIEYITWNEKQPEEILPVIQPVVNQPIVLLSKDDIDKLNEFVKYNYYNDGMYRFTNKKVEGNSKEDFINKAILYIIPRENNIINAKWNKYEQAIKDKKQIKTPRPEIAEQFYNDIKELGLIVITTTPVAPESGSGINTCDENEKLRRSDKDCKEISNEDMDLLKLYEQNEDLDNLQILYKKYYDKNYNYLEGRTTIGKKVYDIVYNFTHSGKDEIISTPKPTSPTPTSQNPNNKNISDEDKILIEKYKRTYSEDNFEPLQEMYKKYYGDYYSPRFGRDYPPNALQNQESDLIYVLQNNGKEDITFYNDYQNEITTQLKAENDETTINKYYDAFKTWANENSTQISLSPNTNLSTQEKLDELIQYMFIYQYNKTKTEIIEPELSDTLVKYYKYLNELSTKSNDSQLIEEYKIATHDRFDYINRSNDYLIQKIKKSKYTPTIEENPQFFKWLNTYLETPTPTETKLVVNQNEVELAFKVTNVSYDEDRPRRLDQLIYLDGYSNRNVSIYQNENTATIYFCSTGSRVEFSGQAAEDWMQSNIAILMGVSTSSFSSRFNEEKRLLNEIVMALRPSIIIFCGHSLGSRLGNELFVYSIEQNKFQPFSVGFNGGSIISVDFTKKYNTEYINHRVLQFHVNYDPLSATNTMGTVVNLPAHIDFSHRMTNFSDFDWSPYENFIETGLQFNSPFNPIDEVIPEDTKPEDIPDIYTPNEDEDSNFDQAAGLPYKPPVQIKSDLTPKTFIDTLLGETSGDLSGILSKPVGMPPQSPSQPYDQRLMSYEEDTF